MADPALNLVQVRASLAALRAGVKAFPVVYLGSYYGNGPDGGEGNFTYEPSDTTSGWTGTGSISGTTLTLASTTSGAMAIGLSPGGAGIPAGVYVTGGSGTSWTLSQNLGTIALQAMTADNGGTIIVDTAGHRYYRSTSGLPYSVKWFGAKGDGTTDDTAAIQAAISATQAAGGGAVWFPAGTYHITDTLNITAGGVTLQGSGTGSTVLSFANGASDCIVMNSGTTQLYRSHVKDMTITGVAKTGGRALYIGYFANCNIERVEFQSAYNGIEIYITNTITLRDILINGITNATGYGIYWHAPSDGSARSDVLNCQNVTIQANYSGADGVVWDGLAQTLNWLHGGILKCRRGLWIKNTGLAISNTPGFLESFGLAIEGASLECVRIEGGYQYRFVDSLLTTMYGSNGNTDDYAVNILADASYSITNSIKFDNCRIGLCAKEAVYCAARNVQFTGCTFPAASLSAPNTYPAVHLLSPAQDIEITGCYDTEWGATSQTNYSVQIDSGVSRVTGVGNYFYAGQTGAVLNNSSDFHINIGPANGSTKNPVPMQFGVPQSNSTAAGTTLTAAQLLSPILLRSGPGAGFTDTTDTAANLIGAMPTPAVDTIYKVEIANTTAFQQTIAAGAGVTFSGNLSAGNFVIAANTTRNLVLQVTSCAAGSQAVTIYG